MGEAWSGDGRIGGVADVRAALARVNAVAQTRGNLALVAEPVQVADDANLDAADVSRALPADAQLRSLLPWRGLRRGASIAAVGSTSLLMMLVAGALHQNAAWAAVVGMPQFGALAAAQDYRIPVDRLGLVPNPGPDWPTVVAALIDGLDVVVAQPPLGAAEGVLRSLTARARQKGAVLICTRTWPGADLTLEVVERRWYGLGAGRGRLRHGELSVQATGRGRAARPRQATIAIPAPPPPLARIPPPPANHRPAPTTTAARLWNDMRPAPAPADLWAARRDDATDQPDTVELTGDTR